MRLALIPIFLLTSAALAASPTDYKFSFGTNPPAAGATPITAETRYAANKGYGIEADTNLPTPGQGTRPAVAPTVQTGKSAISSDKAFIFSAAVPEGVYRVTLTLGDPDADATVTVKAESRRLMLEHLKIPKGTTQTKSFLVHVRRPEIPEHQMLTPRFVAPGETSPATATVPAGTVKLDPREPGSFT